MLYHHIFYHLGKFLPENHKELQHILPTSPEVKIGNLDFEVLQSWQKYLLPDQTIHPGQLPDAVVRKIQISAIGESKAFLKNLFENRDNFLTECILEELQPA